MSKEISDKFNFKDVGLKLIPVYGYLRAADEVINGEHKPLDVITGTAYGFYNTLLLAHLIVAIPIAEEFLRIKL